MGKVRIRLWLHKLCDIRIRGFRRKRRSPAVGSTFSPERSFYFGSNSPECPYFGCGSSQVAQTVRKSSCLRANVQLSPINHKALDIPYLASPRRSPQSPSPSMSPLQTKGLQNSPIPHSVILRSPPIHSTSAITISRPESSIPSNDRNAICVDCGCQPPLALSFRRGEKQKFQGRGASITSDNCKRRSKRRQSSVDKDRRTSCESSKSWESVDTTNVESRTDAEVVQKIASKKGKIARKRKDVEVRQSTLDMSTGMPSSEKNLGSFRICEVHTNEERPKSGPMIASASERRGDKLVSTPNASSVIGLIAPSGEDQLDAVSFAWEKECSSFTSEDNFFSSFERGRPSYSSNSSSEFFERNHVLSCDGILKEARDAGRLRERKLANVHEDSSQTSKRDGGAAAFRSGDSGVQNSSPGRSPTKGQRTAGDQGVIYPWLSQEGSGSGLLEETDLEANSKPWTQQRSPLGRIGEDDEEKGAEGRAPLAAFRMREETSSSEQSSQRGASGGCNHRRQRSSRRGSSAAALRRRAQLQARWRLIGEEEELHRSGEESSNSSTTQPSPIRKEPMARSMRPAYPNSVNVIEAGTRVTDSVAVVKCSNDPFIDFRNSMVDMILEKQIYDVLDLEELLQCFLSLNSLEHHDAIVRAFTEVWEMVFENPP